MSKKFKFNTYLVLENEDEKDVEVTFALYKGCEATRDCPAEPASTDIFAVVDMTGNEIKTTDKQEEQLKEKIWDYVAEGHCDPPEPDFDDIGD